jgi:hypothetical protein
MSKILAHILVSIPSMLIVSLGFNYFNHKAYYTTIQNTQTVDFNILTNTLPTKLSQLLQNNNLGEIQQVISSNYGLFGIIVTNCKEEKRDCRDQKIIAKSQPERKGWIEKSLSKDLIYNLYDILRDPAPTKAEWEFKDARSTEFIPTRKTNKGKIIGRVYYIRRDQPDFIQSQKDWILTPVKSLQIFIETGDSERSARKLYELIDSGANKYYALTNLLGLVAGLFIWRIWERIIYKRKIQQNLYDKRERALNIKINRYQEEVRNFQGEIQRLEIDQFNRKKDEDDLKNKLSEAAAALKKKQKAYGKDSELAKEENSNLIEQLNFAKETVSGKWKLVNYLQQQVDQKNTHIDILELKDKLDQAIKEASISQENAKIISSKLEQSSEDIKNKEVNYLILSRQFLEAQEILKSRESDIFLLQSNLAETSRREKQYIRSIELLNQQKNRLETEKRYLENSWQKEKKEHGEKIKSIDEQLNSLCVSLGQEIEALKDDLNNAREENLFLKEELIQATESEVEIINFHEKANIRFSSVCDALQAIQISCQNLEILESAFKSVDSLNDYLPNKVHENLLSLSNIGELYFHDRLGTNFSETFRGYGVTYSQESDTTMSLYGRERTFRHYDRSITMSQHLKIGRLRIYFEFDVRRRKVLIGYCGKHLPIATG